MPKISFESANKLETAGDFPKLKLDHNEKSRIVCLGEPEYAYVHTLRAPRIVDGVAEKHLVERRDKSTYEDYKLDYVGQPQCLGSYEVLQEKGVDPDSCPMCALAKTDVVAAPQRRFAIHVFQYTVKNNSFDISLPFSGRIVIWRFTDMVFGKLVDIVNEWGPLQEVDLNLGPCTNKDFQKFEISNAKKTEWLEDDEDTDRKKYVATSLSANKAPDLTVFCGKKSELRWIEQDLETIQEKWDIAKGAPERKEANKTVNLNENMDSLLSANKVATEDKTETDDTPQPTTSVKNGKGEKLSLDDLLADI